MELAHLSDWLRNYVTMKLKCKGCGSVTDLGLDALLKMSAQNDDLTWWRERFRCRKCGEKAPYMSIVPTRMTPEPLRGWNPLTQRMKK